MHINLCTIRTIFIWVFCNSIFISTTLLCFYKFIRIHHNLSPKWTTIFLLEHNTTNDWTPLKITIHDSKKSSYTKTNEERQSVDGGGGGGGLFMLSNLTMQRNDEDLYKSNDPVMGEVNVEVGEILRVKGQEMKLDLEHGGW